MLWPHSAAQRAASVSRVVIVIRSHGLFSATLTATPRVHPQSNAVAFNVCIFYLRIKELKIVLEMKRKKNEVNLLMYHRLEMPYQNRLFFLVFQNELGFVFSFRALSVPCLGQISPPFLTANPQFLLSSSQTDWFATPSPPSAGPPILKFLEEKKICRNRLLVFLLVPPNHDDIS